MRNVFTVWRVFRAGAKDRSEYEHKTDTAQKVAAWIARYPDEEYEIEGQGIIWWRDTDGDCYTLAGPNGDKPGAKTFEEYYKLK